jgi:hypothetical protein
VEEERNAKRLAADQEVLAESLERVERGRRALGQSAGRDEKGSDVPSAEEVGCCCFTRVVLLGVRLVRVLTSPSSKNCSDSFLFLLLLLTLCAFISCHCH